MNVPAQLLLSAKKKKQCHYRSVISDIFDGSILSLVQCLTCDRVRCTSHVQTPGVVLREGSTLLCLIWWEWKKITIFFGKVTSTHSLKTNKKQTWTVNVNFCPKQQSHPPAADMLGHSQGGTLIVWMCDRSLRQWKPSRTCPSLFLVKKIWQSSTPPYTRTFQSRRACVPTRTARRAGSPILWTPYAGQWTTFISSESWNHLTSLFFWVL